MNVHRTDSLTSTAGCCTAVDATVLWVVLTMYTSRYGTQTVFVCINACVQERIWKPKPDARQTEMIHWLILYTHTHISHFRPGQALRAPVGWGSQIPRHSAHKIVSPTHRPPLPPSRHPRYSFLSEAQSTGRIKSTFCLVAQCLNQLRHRRFRWTCYYSSALKQAAATYMTTDYSITLHHCKTIEFHMSATCLWLCDMLQGEELLVLPLVVMGSLLMAGGACSLLLPETLNQHLPQSLEDGEKFGKEWSWRNLAACCPSRYN